MRVAYTETAKRDRLKQIEYVEQFSYAAADRLDARIEQHVNLLRRFPRMGKEAEPNGIRELAIQHTELLVRYRIEADRVLILRILHSAQHWPGRF